MKKALTLLFAIQATLLSAQTKYVVVEEGTGTWCSWCPRGTVAMKDLIDKYPTVIPIEVHGNDPMENTDYDNASAFSSFPSGHVNRIYLSESTGDWDARVASELTKTPEADITVTNTYNSVTREASVTVDADFYQALSGDYRLGAIVVENGITGPAPAYDQSNSYSGGGNGPMGGFENLPSPIPASIMVFNHVGRELLGGYEGLASSLPSSISNGANHSHTFTYTVPPEFNAEYIKMVGVLIDASTGSILNAGVSKYLSGNDNENPFFHSNANENGYLGLNYLYEVVCHDPDDDDLTISSSNLPSWLTLTDNGNGTADLKGVPTTKGDYSIDLMLSDGNYTETQSFTITVGDAEEDWQLVGSKGFNNAEVHLTDLAIDGDRVPYVLTASYDTDDYQIFTYNGSNWNQLGSNFQYNNYLRGSIGVSKKGDLFYFNNGEVFNWDGTDWNKLGNTLPTYFSMDLGVSPSGTPYYCAEGEVFKWDGSDWISLGRIEAGTGTVYGYNFKFDANENPVVIYMGDPGTNLGYSKVSRYDGTQWEELGKVDGSEYTYFYHDLAVTSTGEIYVVATYGFSSPAANLYHYDNGIWKMVKAKISGGSDEYCRLEVDINDNLIVVYNDNTAGAKLSAQRYDGTNWKYLGAQGFTGISSNPALAIGPHGWPMVAYQDNDVSGKITVKQYIDFNAPTPPGVGIQEDLIKSENSFVYPNPSNGTFSFPIGNGEAYALYNLKGQLIKRGISTKDEIINISNLNIGSYILKIQTKTGNFAQQVVITK